MEEKKELLQSFVDDVFRIMGDSVKKIILYGSYARGDFRPDSDMDIMILTSLDEAGIRKLENQLYDRAVECELSDGVNISINIKNQDHFNYWLGALPYYDNVDKEGIVLAG